MWLFVPVCCVRSPTPWPWWQPAAVGSDGCRRPGWSWFPPPRRAWGTAGPRWWWRSSCLLAGRPSGGTDRETGEKTLLFLVCGLFWLPHLNCKRFKWGPECHSDVTSRWLVRIIQKHKSAFCASKEHDRKQIKPEKNQWVLLHIFTACSVLSCCFKQAFYGGSVYQDQLLDMIEVGDI